MLENFRGVSKHFKAFEEVTGSFRGFRRVLGKFMGFLGDADDLSQRVVLVV